MAIPAAPLEGNGARLLFLLWDNTGTNAAALLRALGKTTLNTEAVAHLAVATHENADTFGATDPVAVLAGVDGTTVRRAIVDASGRVISRPALVYDDTGNNAFAHPRTLAQGSLNGEAVGHVAMGSHVDGEAFDASDPVVVAAGVSAGTAKRLAADTTGRLLTDTGLALAAQGHANVAVTGTAVALSGSAACRRVQVKADAANVATLYVGASTVTADETAGTGGYQLEAGEAVEVYATNIANVYINGTANDGASFMRIG